MVRKVLVLLDARDQLIDQVVGNKKLKICFLIDITVFWAPSINRVRRLGTIDSRLRVDRQEASSVKVDQALLDGISFCRNSSVTPGKSFQFALQIANKDIRNIFQRLRLAPQLDVLIVRALETYAISVKLTKGR